VNIKLTKTVVDVIASFLLLLISYTKEHTDGFLHTLFLRAEKQAVVVLSYVLCPPNFPCNSWTATV